MKLILTILLLSSLSFLISPLFVILLFYGFALPIYGIRDELWGAER